jgi:hypothetical protein
VTEQNDTPAVIAVRDAVKAQPGPFPLHPDATEAACAAAGDYVARVVEDTIAAVDRRRSIVAFEAAESEVRYIARIAARMAVGLTHNPDRSMG